MIQALALKSLPDSHKATELSNLLDQETLQEENLTCKEKRDMIE
jgi:hypothetical protein